MRVNDVVDDKDGEAGREGATCGLGNTLLLVGAAPRITEGATTKGDKGRR